VFRECKRYAVNADSILTPIGAAMTPQSLQLC
jgi:hypothetical protein